MKPSKDDIIRMAREARLMSETQDGSAWSAPTPNFEYPERLEHFASLVAAAEREACAKVCDDWPNNRDDVYSIGVAIRARGSK